MLEFIKNILLNDFMPHGHCFSWSPDVLWLFVISDSLITVSYYSIPGALIYFIFKRKDLSQIKQVVLNLLTNAEQSILKDGGIIKVK